MSKSMSQLQNHRDRSIFLKIRGMIRLFTSLKIGIDHKLHLSLNQISYTRPRPDFGQKFGFEIYVNIDPLQYPGMS